MALVVTPISPGVQSYMVLTDSGPPQQSMLAYFDDLGRGFCYFEKSLEIRLVILGATLSDSCIIGFVRHAVILNGVKSTSLYAHVHTCQDLPHL